MEKGIVAIAECPTVDSSGLNVSAIKKSGEPGTDFACSIFSEGMRQMLNDINVENIRPTEDESSQKPATQLIPAGLRPSIKPKLKPREEPCEQREDAPEENVSETPGARTPIHVNPSVFSEGERIKLNDTRKRCMGKMQLHTVKTVVKKKPAIGKMEGFLEKLSNGLIYSWKVKYCYLQNSTFLFYKNLEAGRLSGCIDFARVPCELRVDPVLGCFTYLDSETG